MAYDEESKSRLEQAIGRRFPLAVIFILALCWAAFMKIDTLTSSLAIIVGIIGVSYFQDIKTEHQELNVLKQEVQESKTNE